jgi:serine/threonine protein phosphatase PrpC
MISIDSYAIKGEDVVWGEAKQDTYSLVVCDGHGSKGEAVQCAEFCVEKSKAFTDWLLTQPYVEWDESLWKQTMDDHFTKVHDLYRVECASQMDRFIDKQGIVRSCNGMTIHGGTTYSRTFTFSIPTGFRTILSHVGDSDIYLNGVKVSEGEKERNQSTFARIQSIPFMHRMKMVTHDGRYYDPLSNNEYDIGLESSLYQKDHMRLANPRCIGDFYGHPMGLTCLPFFRIIDTLELPEIIIASDGVWNLRFSETWHDIPFELESGEFLKRVNSLHDYYGVRKDDLSIVMLSPTQRSVYFK